MGNALAAVQGFFYRLFLWAGRFLTRLHRDEVRVGERGRERLKLLDSRRPRRHRSRDAPILLLHGFTADKETWLKMAWKLGRDHRLVAPDLAGHGASSEAADDDYSLGRQAERAHQVAVRLGLGPHHLLAHSMGGAVAMTYALAHPEAVLSLGLISPAGAVDPHTREFLRLLKGTEDPSKGEVNSLIVSGNWTALEKVRYVTQGPPALHRVTRLVGSYLTRRDLEREGLYRRIFRQISEAIPDEGLRQISQPTFILWGTEDRVLRPESAEHLAKRIPGARQPERLPGVGHTPPLEKAAGATRSYLKFLGTVEEAL